MRPHLHLRALLLTLGVTGACLAQSATPAPNSPASPPPCSPTATTPCAPEARKPSAAERFPYPGTPPAASAPNAPAASQPDVPDAPATAPGDAARQHPYPGTSPPPESSGSSSSGSSSSSSSSDPAVADPNAGPDTPDPAAPPRRRKLAKIEAKTDDERAGEDLDVAHYYFGRGNYNAAYLRSKDAVKAQPDDPEGHFALAEAAQKLNKRDEAIAEYKQYLSLEPDGTKARLARKALDNLK